MKLEAYDALFHLGIVNGCGAKNSDNFDDLISQIMKLSYFDPEKGKDLAQRMKLEACGPHDADYHDGGKEWERLIADILLVVRIYRLLDWTNTKFRYVVVIP